MDILTKIVNHKKIEVEKRKLAQSIQQLSESALFAKQCLSMKESILEKDFGIISEFKRKSPSKGFINEHALVSNIVPGYAEAGAAGISVLTDTDFFGGSFDDLRAARKLVNIPLLQKDFVVDEFQLYEAKALGADVILLIAAALTVGQTHTLAQKAKQLGLEVLLELHGDNELEHINSSVDMVGINNRNLKTFKVDIEASLRLAEQIPDTFVKVSESGLSSADTIRMLKQHGFKAFLMGESFMKEPKPAEALASLMEQLKG